MQDKASLSPRQKRILEMIQSFTAENGYPPTIRQIGETVGISSTSVVSYNLSVLQKKGYILRDQEVSRGLRLVPEVEPPAVSPSLLHVPLLGAIAAGEPIPVPDEFAQLDDVEQMLVPNEMCSSAEGVYALQVRGTSMIDALINDGDVVLIRHQVTARNGDMVVAWLKDEKATTLKHFYWEKGQARVRLQPANPLMEPIYVHPGNLEIQGKVIGVIRQMD